MQLKQVAAPLLAAVLAAVPLLCAGTPAFAASYDYRFQAQEYTGYYTPSDAQIRHDGHGAFHVEDTRGVITSGSGVTAVIRPSGREDAAAARDGYPAYPGAWQGNGPSEQAGTAAQPGERLGTLGFFGRSIPVYEGALTGSLLKGAAHFSGTPAWDGNVCLAGHNRGPNAHFSRLRELSAGDSISYATPAGTRSYRVFSVRTVSVNDLSPLSSSDRNLLTLVSCVANQPSLRLIVQAEQTGEAANHA